MTNFECAKQRMATMSSSSIKVVLLLLSLLLISADGFGSSNSGGTTFSIRAAVDSHFYPIMINHSRKTSSRINNGSAHPVFNNDNNKNGNHNNNSFGSGMTLCSTMQSLTTAFVSKASAVADPNVSMNLWNSIRTVISSLSMSPSIVSDVIVSTPPMAYFLALLAAGCGVPISEDAMCILVGASWNALQEQQKRNTVILSLYFGIVFSDYLTFIIGRTLRRGVLEPIRKKILGNDAIDNNTILSTSTTSSNDNVDEGGKKKKRRKRDRALAKISQAGDYVGFITRLSVGMRGPMILFTGFSGTTTFTKFAVGTFLGAFVSLPIQLLIGYRMNIAATAGNTVFNVSTVATAGLVVSLSTIGLSSLPLITKSCKLIISRISNVFVDKDTVDTSL